MKMAMMVVAFLVSYFLTPKTLFMLESGGLSRENFRGSRIPSAGGIIFPAVLAITYGLFTLWGEIGPEAYIYLGFISLVGLAGLVDDIAGNKERSGFHGHFKDFFLHGQLTTGFWKAGVGGVIAALAASIESISFGDFIVNVLLVALVTNLFNLLDVRPGRSIKVFIFSSIMIMLFLPSYTGSILLIPLLGIVLAYGVYDIRSQAMMGDAGSNVIGMAVGLALVSSGGIGVKLILLAGLVSLNALSEYRSFSEYIEKNKVLYFLDLWGRRE
ncbi:MAG: hypothetical protein ACOYI2_08725 [Bacillota bacterium]|nr:hypothetical protein [Clostridia bacterium]